MRSIALLLLFSTVIAAESGLDPAKDLKSAQDAYAVALAKAQGDYDAAAKKAAGEYREKLKVIQADRTKAGDLDGAVAVRGLLAELDEAEPPSPTKNKELVARDKFSAALTKVVWASGPGGWGQNFVFATDGYVYSPPRKRMSMTWAAVAPGTVVTVNHDGVIDVFTIDLVKGTVKVKSVGSTQRPAASWEAAKAK